MLEEIKSAYKKCSKNKEKDELFNMIKRVEHREVEYILKKDK